MNTDVLHRYEQLTLRSGELREELHTELEKIIQYIINFKLHIQGSLENYEEFVAAECEREWQEQEAADGQLDVELGAEEEVDAMEE